MKSYFYSNGFGDFLVLNIENVSEKIIQCKLRYKFNNKPNNTN